MFIFLSSCFFLESGVVFVSLWDGFCRCGGILYGYIFFIGAEDRGGWNDVRIWGG